MITVSPEFEAAVGADVRRWVPKVEVTWTDPFIDASITAPAPADNNYISYPEQTADLVTAPTRKWAHLDGTFKPDGTFYPCPSSAEAAAGAQMGWWGANRCDASGEWAIGNYPTLTIQFAARPVLALVVTGDAIYGEYPVDFTVGVYDADDTLLASATVTGNTLMTWRASIAEDDATDATYMVLTVKKWSAPLRVVKIMEFYTALVETYTGDEVESMSLLEEREISDGSVPIGNIAANELDLSLQNISIIKDGETIIDPFFPSNPNTYLHAVVKKNRRVRAWVGLVLPDDSVEYIALGTFWTGDWSAEEQSAIVSTSCRDRMELLRKAVCATMPLMLNVTLYDLADALLTEARTEIPMPDLYWEIDTALQGFTVPYGFFPRQDYFTCIKDIVTACMGQAYMSRDDVLIITGPGSYSRPGVGA